MLPKPRCHSCICPLKQGQVPFHLAPESSTSIFHIKEIPGGTIVPICSYGTSDLTWSESADSRGRPRLRGWFYSRRSATRNEKDPRVIYFCYIKKRSGSFFREGGSWPISLNQLSKERKVPFRLRGIVLIQSTKQRSSRIRNMKRLAEVAFVNLQDFIV